MNAHWTPGITIGLPVLGFFLLLAIALLVLAQMDRRLARKEGVRDLVLDAPFAVFGTAVAIIAIAGILLGVGLGYFPYSAQYHRWVPKTGTVQSVGTRYIGDDGSTKYVVEYADHTLYGCLDTRCSLVKPGDHLVLSCIRSFQWSGTAGWDCNYVTDNRIGAS